MATTLSEAQAAAALELTTRFKAEQNREAARIAALIALFYQQRVNVEDPTSIDRWLEIMIPRLIQRSDSGARSAAVFFDALRRIEISGGGFQATPSLGTIDEGVRKSLLFVGPQKYAEKVSEIQRLDISPSERRAMLAEAKRITTTNVARSVVRHAQAGSRQTIHDNAAQDPVALGWVRVTRAKPCFFCAMIASRGIHYRSFQEGSFDMSDSRFTGEGDAKVHDQCGCCLKPVYADNDPLVDRTEKFAELWSLWGAGGGDAALRFRRGYEHWSRTGDYLTWDQANEGLRAS